MRLRILLAVAFIIVRSTFAEAVVEKKLFTMEKSYHAENIMVINTQTDDNCNFSSKNSEYVDFFWLMDGKNRKEIHSMIRNQVQARIKFSGINTERNLFTMRLNDLNELKHDLEDTAIEVSTGIINGACRVKSVLKLGPSGKYRKLNLKRTYCEVSTSFVGIPNGCKFIELQGTDVDTDEALKIRFNSK